MTLATRICFLMQRFVRGLRRMMERAQRLAMFHGVAEVISFYVTDTYTWRDATRGIAMEIYHDIAEHTISVRDLMIATHIRFMMHRFVRGLRRLVASSERPWRRPSIVPSVAISAARV